MLDLTRFDNSRCKYPGDLLPIYWQRTSSLGASRHWSSFLTHYACPTFQNGSLCQQYRLWHRSATDSGSRKYLSDFLSHSLTENTTPTFNLDTRLRIVSARSAPRLLPRATPEYAGCRWPHSEGTNGDKNSLVVARHRN